MRDLGELAEEFFRVWCTSAELIPNGSRFDRTGWDFFVEFPWKRDASIAKDMLPSPIECKVQVKGTDKKKRSVSIPLSNLNRLIKVPLPAFYCLIEFDGMNEPQSAFLVHVDKPMIERTLRKIRELEFKKGDRNLSKHTMTVKFSDNDRLEPPFAESLEKAIEGHAVDGMEKYVENKNQLLRTLGFENGAYLVKFTTSGEDSVQRVVDASLGLLEKVEIDKFEGRHSRFGILSNKPVFEGEKGYLSFHDIKPLTTGTVRFKENDFSPSISFQTHVYFSPFTRLAGDKFMKVRLEGDFFQMVIGPNSTINCSFSREQGTKFSQGVKRYFEGVNPLEKISRGANLGN